MSKSWGGSCPPAPPPPPLLLHHWLLIVGTDMWPIVFGMQVYQLSGIWSFIVQLTPMCSKANNCWYLITLAIVHGAYENTVKPLLSRLLLSYAPTKNFRKRD